MAHGHGHHGGAARGLMGARLGGAVNTVLKASVGAGAALLGAYVFQRERQRADLAARIDKLEALVKELEKKSGDGTGE